VKNICIYSFISICVIVACNQKSIKTSAEIQTKDSSRTYGDDRDFLKKYTDIIELSNGESKVLIAPKLQGRVMTSTCQGDVGYSYGWINYSLFESGKYMDHINAYGGEERFWMGPEGGQFALFFKKGDPFDIKHWQTPGIIDTASFDLTESNSSLARFTKKFEIENYSGTRFSVNVDREIKLLDVEAIKNILGISLEDVNCVGYQSSNSITNNSNKDWNLENGVLSIWLLSMINTSLTSTIVLPYKTGQANFVNDTYFGKVPKERLIKYDSFLVFKGDANYRGKIGLPPSIAKEFTGSFDSVRNILTIIKFEKTQTEKYVNSMWENQKFPYKGDVVNAYNDGPNENGNRLGSFYELESSSPAVALKKNEKLIHKQNIFHIQTKNKKALNVLALQLLGVDLNILK